LVRRIVTGRVLPFHFPYATRPHCLARNSEHCQSWNAPTNGAMHCLYKIQTSIWNGNILFRKFNLILKFKVIERSTYLCPKEISSSTSGRNFDFHCIPGATKGKPPKFEADIVEWYPICGVQTSQQQRAELTGVIWFVNF
jgi:hypothetical protein